MSQRVGTEAVVLTACHSLARSLPHPLAYLLPTRSLTCLLICPLARSLAYLLAYMSRLPSRQGFVSVVRILVESGGDVDVVNGEGSSPLHWAARKDHASTVSLLLELGATRDL